ncbi:MAG: cell division protein PerM [Actinomycetota bacterium]
MADFASSVRVSLARGGWPDAAAVAAFSFLVLLTIGAILLAAAKVQQPELGAGGDPIEALTAVVILSLASLGAPVSIGELEISVLPLGALAGFGFAIAWATGRFVARRDAMGLSERALEGIKPALPLALMCWVASLVFRLRGESPIGAGAIEALLLAAIWGVLFGAAGGALANTSPRDLVRSATARLRDRLGARFAGVMAGVVMLVVVVVLAMGAVLLWIIVAAARGALPERFGAGDAVAAFVFFLAFLPNIVVAVVALSLGAPIEVGARLTFGGKVVGSLQEFSVLDWGRADPPTLLYALLLIPLASCLLGGVAAYRAASDRSRMAEIIATAAATFALALTALAVLGDARLGLGVLDRRGFGVVAPGEAVVLVLALIWALVIGLVGWKIAGRQTREDRP